MRFILYLLIIPYFFTQGAQSKEADVSPTFIKWDKIIDQASSFNDFYKNDQLKEQFFLELKNYYSEYKITPVSYNMFLDQLKKIADADPEFSKSLWEKRAVRPSFEINYKLSKSVDIIMNNKEWYAKLDKIEERLKNEAKDFLLLKDQSAINTKIKNRLFELEKKIKEFYLQLNTNTDVALSKNKRISLAENYINSLTDTKEIKEIAAYITYKNIHDNEALNDALRSGNGANTLLALEELQNQEKNIVNKYALTSNDSLVSLPKAFKKMLSKLLPTPMEMKSDKKLIAYSSLSGSEKMIFYDVSRPFYSIFRGAFTGECVGGNCYYLQKNLTPERHAVPVLLDTEVRFAESVKDNNEHHFKGFTELTPFLNKKDQKTYGSLVVGVPDFKKEVYVPEAPGGAFIKTSVYDLWIKNVPKFHSGIVTSLNKTFDNSHTMDRIKNSFSHINADDVGNREDFSHLEKNQKMVKSIVSNSPDIEFSQYGEKKQLITDGTLPVNEKMLRLYPGDFNQFLDQFKNANNETKEKFLLNTMEWSNEDKSKIFKKLLFLLNDKNEEIAKQFAYWATLGKISDPRIESRINQVIYSNHLTDTDKKYLNISYDTKINFPEKATKDFLDPNREIVFYNKYIANILQQKNMFNHAQLKKIPLHNMNNLFVELKSPYTFYDHADKELFLTIFKDQYFPNHVRVNAFFRYLSDSKKTIEAKDQKDFLNILKDLNYHRDNDKAEILRKLFERDNLKILKSDRLENLKTIVNIMSKIQITNNSNNLDNCFSGLYKYLKQDDIEWNEIEHDLHQLEINLARNNSSNPEYRSIIQSLTYNKRLLLLQICTKTNWRCLDHIENMNTDDFKGLTDNIPKNLDLSHLEKFFQPEVHKEVRYNLLKTLQYMDEIRSEKIRDFLLATAADTTEYERDIALTLLAINFNTDFKVVQFAAKVKIQNSTLSEGDSFLRLSNAINRNNPKKSANYKEFNNNIVIRKIKKSCSELFSTFSKK